MRPRRHKILLTTPLYIPNNLTDELRYRGRNIKQYHNNYYCVSLYDKIQVFELKLQQTLYYTD